MSVATTHTAFCYSHDKPVCCACSIGADHYCDGAPVYALRLAVRHPR